jgi:hypothetical protein
MLSTGWPARRTANVNVLRELPRSPGLDMQMTFYWHPELYSPGLSDLLTKLKVLFAFPLLGLAHRVPLPHRVPLVWSAYFDNCDHGNMGP